MRGRCCLFFFLFFFLCIDGKWESFGIALGVEADLCLFCIYRGFYFFVAFRQSLYLAVRVEKVSKQLLSLMKI